MSFEQLLEQLPALSFEQRQLLIRRALDLDEVPLSRSDEAEIDRRLEAHRQNPELAISIDALKARVRTQFPK